MNHTPDFSQLVERAPHAGLQPGEEGGPERADVPRRRPPHPLPQQRGDRLHHEVVLRHAAVDLDVAQLVVGLPLEGVLLDGNSVLDLNVLLFDEYVSGKYVSS